MDPQDFLRAIRDLTKAISDAIRLFQQHRGSAPDDKEKNGHRGKSNHSGGSSAVHDALGMVSYYRQPPPDQPPDDPRGNGPRRGQAAIGDRPSEPPEGKQQEQGSTSGGGRSWFSSMAGRAGRWFRRAKHLGPMVKQTIGHLRAGRIGKAFRFAKTIKNGITKTLGGIRAASKSMGGPATTAIAVGVVGAAAYSAAKAIYELGNAAKEETKARFESMRQYADVSASMAVVFSLREMNKVFLNMEKGNRISGSAYDLMESEKELDQSTKDLDVLAENVGNFMQTIKNDVLSALLSPLNAIAKGINDLLFDDKDELKPIDMSKWVEEAAKLGDRVMNEGDGFLNGRK